MGLSATNNYTNQYILGSPTPSAFNVFDNHNTFFRGLNSNLSSINNVFQNTAYTSNSQGSGSAIYFNSTLSQLNNVMDLTAPNKDVGNRFWNCHRGIEGKNVYQIHVQHAIFRSDQGNFDSPNAFLRGNTGILLGTNRFRYFFTSNEFSNLKTGIIIPLAAGATTLVQTCSVCPSAGIFASNIAIVSNTFTGASGGFAYMDKAIDITAPNGGVWTIGTYSTIAPYTIGTIIQGNTVASVHRGIYINGLKGFKTRVNLNDITLVEDVISNSNAQYGIQLVGNVNNAIGQSVISENYVNCISANGGTNTNISLVYCGDNAGAGLQTPSVTCNVLSNANKGFVFEGPNPGTRWMNNYMESHAIGMPLSYDGVIGTQGSSTLAIGNVWNGTWASGINYGIYTYTSNAALSPLYVSPSNVPLNLDGNPMQLSYGNTTLSPIINSNYNSFNCASPSSILSDPHLPNSEDYRDENQYYIALTNYYRVLEANDSLLNADPSFNAFFSMASSTTLFSFMDVERFLKNGDLISAASTLSGITATNTVEGNYKSYYHLYLNYATNNFNPTNDADEIDLLNLASACPGTGGACVYQSRALYNTVFKDARSYPVCDGSAARLATFQRSESNSTLWKVDLFPNPATNKITLQSSTEDDIVKIAIRDLTGRTLLTTTLQLKSYLATLDLNLVNGAYLVTVTNIKNELLIKKLLIAN